MWHVYTGSRITITLVATRHSWPPRQVAPRGAVECSRLLRDAG
jgi:hypothetical protein